MFSFHVGYMYPSKTSFSPRVDLPGGGSKGLTIEADSWQEAAKKAKDWYAENHEASDDIMAELFGTGVDPEVIILTWEENDEKIAAKVVNYQTLDSSGD